MNETRPERELREFTEAVAGRIPGAEAEIHGLYDDADTERLDTILALIAGRGVTHMLNRNGFVVVPIDGGVRDVTVEPVEVHGEPYVDLAMFLRVDITVSDSVRSDLTELMVELNSYPGPKVVFLPDSGVIKLHSELPAAGLTAEALFTEIAVFGRAARQHEQALEGFDAGHPPQGVWEQIGWEAPEDAFKT